MSLQEVYQLRDKLRDYLPSLGAWQALTMAMYCYGIILAEKCMPGKVAEKCGVFGRLPSVQRRLERWLDNQRLRWYVICREWSRWVLNRYSGEQLLLLVDETKIGNRLAAMVVALAYRGSSIPLVFWAYDPSDYPNGGQVGVISELLSWVLEGVPDGQVPIIQADRGIGTSPDLIRSVQALGWQVLFRVQNQTRVMVQGQERSIRHLANAPGQHWSATGYVFKKAGWLALTIHVIWAVGYQHPWLLVTNAPAATTRDGWLYALRYWQEASFRDLKSDGWHWHSARIFLPDHANRLLLVLVLASAWMLTLGTLTFDNPVLARYVTKPSRRPLSLFRLGLRLFNFLRAATDCEFALPPLFLAFSDPPPLVWIFPQHLPHSITVGA